MSPVIVQKFFLTNWLTMVNWNCANYSCILLIELRVFSKSIDFIYMLHFVCSFQGLTYTRRMLPLAPDPHRVSASGMDSAGELPSPDFLLDPSIPNFWLRPWYWQIVPANRKMSNAPSPYVLVCLLFDLLRWVSQHSFSHRVPNKSNLPGDDRLH